MARNRSNERSHRFVAARCAAQRAIVGPADREARRAAMLGDVDLADVPRHRFEAMVAAAIDSIPRDLAEHIDNVAVVVADWPTPAQLDGRRGTLLGLYEGINLTRRSPLGYGGVMPDRITIFRGPLTRIARDETDLAARVRTTVLHEFAHHFGISDERLDELGWA